MKTIKVANTPKGRRTIIEAADSIDKGARTRLLLLCEGKIHTLFKLARKLGYSAIHGGGVANSYPGQAESSAILVIPYGPRHYLVTVGCGRAPRGPYGKVGPSVRPQLGCPWGDATERAERLADWSMARYRPE